MPRPIPAALAAAALLALAAAPAVAQTKPGEIKGVDAMGDKSRSAQDGWSQAPVPRDQSAGKDAPNPGGKPTADSGARPVPASSGPGSSATDPQAPIRQGTGTPSGTNAAAPSR